MVTAPSQADDLDGTAENNPPRIELVEAIIGTIKQQLGKPYKVGTEGPDRFDCSGLVFFGFHENDAIALIGGGRHKARWYARWFQERGKFIPATSPAAKRGDLVFYGTPDNISHVGIFLGVRRKPLISALVNPYGVSRTKMKLVEANGSPLPIAGYGQVQY